MGIQDRDWYREERRDRAESGWHFKKYAKPKNWLLMVFFWVSVLFLLYQFTRHLDRFTLTIPFSATPKPSRSTPVAPVVPGVEVRSLTPSHPIVEAPPAPYQAPVAQPAPTQVAAANSPATATWHPESEWQRNT